jgi:hypothetical protein
MVITADGTLEGTGTGTVLMGPGRLVGVGVGVSFTQGGPAHGEGLGVGVKQLVVIHGVGFPQFVLGHGGVTVALFTTIVRVATPPGGFGPGLVGWDMREPIHHISPSTTSTPTPTPTFFDVFILFLLPPVIY